MQVIDALTGLRSLVEDESIAIPIHFALVGDAVRHLHHPRQHRGLVAGEIVDGGNVHFRDDEHVGWRHRPDVLEGDDVVLAEDFFRGNLPREDLAEQAVLSHRHSLRAEETVPAAGHRSDGCERAQRLTARGRVHRDVVVTQATHPGRIAPVPDHFQFPVDEARLVRPALGLSLRLQPVAAFFADRVVHGQAEPGGGRSRSR